MTRMIGALLAGFLALGCGGKSAPPQEPAHDHNAHDHGGGPPPQVTPDAGVVSSQPDAAAPTAEELLAAEQAAFERAKPVFEKNCARCHTKGGKNAKPEILGHLEITSYPFAGHHADEASARVRKVLGITGEKPTMPADDPGAVKGDELALIAAWADAFDASHAGGAHQGHGHDHGGHKH